MQKIILEGKEIVIRKLAPVDLKNPGRHLDYFNAILDEDLYISTNKRISVKEEKDYLENMLAGQAKGDRVCLVAECGGKIISHVGSALMAGKQNHIAVLGFAIANGFRRIGLGSVLMEKLLFLSAKDLSPKPRIIQSGIFSVNKASLALHEKFGFSRAALIPGQFMQDGKLMDEIIVQLYL